MFILWRIAKSTRGWNQIFGSELVWRRTRGRTVASSAWTSQRLRGIAKFMLWRVPKQRLPILVLAYAFALQVIVAGWGAALHGPGFTADTLFGTLCRSSDAVFNPAGKTPSSPDQLPAPSGHHDCALACLNALGGGSFAMAQVGGLPARDAPVAAVQPMDGLAFAHLRTVSASFAARAPPHLV